MNRSEQLEYALVGIVRRSSEGRHQDHWGGWHAALRTEVPEFEDAELLAAFKRLWKRGVLRLTKPDSQRRDATQYSGNDADDEAFFFVNRFSAVLTADGYSVWDGMAAPKTTVFISHISEEKALALRLQELIKTAFSNAFPVFASSDPASLGGGDEWYHHILDNLGKAKVVLVLLSVESVDRSWIAFEAGHGVGQKSRVIPIACRGLSFDSLEFPLKGLQGYYLQQLTDILKEIATRMSFPIGSVDVAAAWQEINEIQSELPARKIALEVAVRPAHPKAVCEFFLVNHGNRDIEPLEVTIWFPSGILHGPFNPAIDPTILEVGHASIDGIDYHEITYRNNREPTLPDRFHRPERLTSCVAPGMRSKLQLVSIEVRYPLVGQDLNGLIRYRIVAKNIKSVERSIRLPDILMAPNA